MRRRKEQATKLRVKILRDRKDELTYEEIQRKRGASSRTIANLVKRYLIHLRRYTLGPDLLLFRKSGS